MKLIRASAIAILICLSGKCDSHAQTQMSPTAVVDNFARLDFLGYRLWSGGIHEEIWHLTAENGNPPDAPTYLISSYRIGNIEKLSASTYSVTVHYKIIGVFSNTEKGPTLRAASRNQEETLTVACASDCKIDISYEKMKLTPHIGEAAAIAWIQRFKEPPVSKDQMRYYDSLIAQIHSAVSTQTR